MKDTFIPRQYKKYGLILGMARVIDLGATLATYYESNGSNPNESREIDRLALQSDWQSIGDDFRYAIGRYEHVETA